MSSSKHFIGAVEDEWPLFSDRPGDYKIGSPIGFGASSVVYAAVYVPASPGRPRSIPCALKVLDLDSLPPHSLALLQRETQLMSLSKHPNVLRVRGCWIDGHKLHIALRLMNKGSAADIIKHAWPAGMEEEVVKCILKQALEGLNYLHINGFIHRDIKAANLLVDDDGTVLVGDLGVAAPLVDDAEQLVIPPVFLASDCNPPRPKHSDNGTRPSRPKLGKRRSFVGTPCWMAPELIQGKRYDAKADIWSFGITAIELTQGRPPRSHENVHNVLLETVQGRPPTLAREGGIHRYSRAFKDIVDACLAKDPSKRPTAAELLHTPFFKSAKKKSYLVGTILDGLAPLAARQQRHHHPENLVTQCTTASWDFSSSTSFQTPSLIAPGSRAVQITESLSLARKHNYDDEPETFRHSSKDGSLKCTRETITLSATTSPFRSDALFMSRPTRPIPIARRDGTSGHRRATPPSDSPPPNSTPPLISSSFWDKLTWRPRSALTDRKHTKGSTF